MKSVIKPKLNKEVREPINTAIPRETPFVVVMEPSSACNIRCEFCFHSDLEAIKKANIKFGVMSYSLFCKIIDDMKKDWGGRKNKVKKLRLAGLGEPLVCPDICRMVEYAKNAEVVEAIEMYTNGVLLTEEISLGLINAGLDQLIVSLNGINEEQYLKVCDSKIDFDNLLKQIKFFGEHKENCKLHIKYGDIGYSNKEKDGFYALFDGICDDMFVERIQGDIWPDTNVNEKIKSSSKTYYGEEIIEKYICPVIFEYLNINHNGLAVMCSSDWKNEYILGDLNKESVDQVWQGENLLKIQRAFLSRQKEKIALCKDCKRYLICNPDNLDEYADEILKRLNRREMCQ